MRAAAADDSCDHAQVERACERLFLAHQRRLVQYARLKGCDEHGAEDLVQDLFLRLIRLGLLVRLSGEPDETQTAHLTRTLRCMIVNQWRDRARLRRGGDCATSSLDEMLAEGREVAGESHPSSKLDRAWAPDLLERGLARLRARMDPQRWSRIEPTLLDEVPSDGFHHSDVAHRVATHRARLELRRYLTRETGCGSDTRRASFEIFRALAHCA